MLVMKNNFKTETQNDKDKEIESLKDEIKLLKLNF